MNTYTIPFSDFEASISIEPTTQGYRAHSLLFDEYADIVSETDSTHYLSYCITEICARELVRLYPDIATNEWDILAAAGMPECACD